MTDWALAEPESAGGDEKVWLQAADGVRWLFKPRTEHETWAEGEDWAEKISAEVGRALGVHVALVELATRGAAFGSISRDLAPPGWELQPGALLLAELLDDYQPGTKTREGHDLSNVQRALSRVAPPVGTAGTSAFDVFAGFLVLDALIANQDRHEENWAVLRPLPGGGALTLAPSYDHGFSLGFNLLDKKRMLEIGWSGIAAWASRARAQRFDWRTDGRLTLVDLASQALTLISADGRRHWTSRVASTTERDLMEVVDRIPGLSEPTRTFTTTLLTTN